LLLFAAVQANYLRSQGVKKGDAVSIYMPMVCELPIAMLACARIGAVHSVVFGGFSAEALAGACNSSTSSSSSSVMMLQVCAGSQRTRFCSMKQQMQCSQLSSWWLGLPSKEYSSSSSSTLRRLTLVRQLLCETSSMCLYHNMIIIEHVRCCCCSGRMEDCKAKVLITASGVMRGNKKIDLKSIADSAHAMCAKAGHTVPRVVVYENDRCAA
jgi:acyl-coenzyme A synthetase/AMP-(fatty) acid ligase